MTSQESGTFSYRGFIVVLESDPDEMFRISEYLKANNFRAFGVEDEKEVYGILEKERPDCIIIDMNLAGEDRADILNRMNSSYASMEIPFVAIVRSESERDLASAIADAVIKKPFEIEALGLALDKIFSDDQKRG